MNQNGKLPAWVISTRYLVARTYPYFSELLFGLTFVPLKKIQTISIDQDGHVYFNPNFFLEKSWSIHKAATILVNELCRWPLSQQPATARVCFLQNTLAQSILAHNQKKPDISKELLLWAENREKHPEFQIEHLDLPDPEILIKNPELFHRFDQDDKTYATINSVAEAYISSWREFKKANGNNGNIVDADQIQRYRAVWEIFGRVAEQGCPEVVVHGASKVLAEGKPKDAGLSPHMAKFYPMLKLAGF